MNQDASNTPPRDVSLTIRGIFDDEREAVGLAVQASESFDESDNTRAKVEVLAAIASKANALAAEIIRTWTEDDAQRRSLYEHFASLKEHMLNDMLKRMDAPPSEEN